MSFTLPAAYGWTVLSGVGTMVTMMYLGSRVDGARKKFNVPLPQMYAADPANPFNLFQRGHQNALETHHMFLWMMLVSGIQYPVFSAGAGLLWSIGRVLYAVGYTKGVTKRYAYGGFVAHLPFLGLAVTSVMTGLRLVGYIN